MATFVFPATYQEFERAVAEVRNARVQYINDRHPDFYPAEEYRIMDMPGENDVHPVKVDDSVRNRSVTEYSRDQLRNYSIYRILVPTGDVFNWPEEFIRIVKRERGRWEEGTTYYVFRQGFTCESLLPGLFIDLHVDRARASLIKRLANVYDTVDIAFHIYSDTDPNNCLSTFTIKMSQVYWKALQKRTLPIDHRRWEPTEAYTMTLTVYPDESEPDFLTVVAPFTKLVMFALVEDNPEHALCEIDWMTGLHTLSKLCKLLENRVHMPPYISEYIEKLVDKTAPFEAPLSTRMGMFGRFAHSP